MTSFATEALKSGTEDFVEETDEKVTMKRSDAELLEVGDSSRSRPYCRWMDNKPHLVGSFQECSNGLLPLGHNGPLGSRQIL